MNEAQRIRQMQACHVTYKRLQADGILPDALSAHDYATMVTGRRVTSLKELTDQELNALCDRLNGKDNKSLAKLYALAREAGITDLAGWMKVSAARGGAFLYLTGHTPESLPMPAAQRLCQCLAARIEANRTRAARELEPTLF